MSLRRYAARRDANERPIIQALEQVGCKVAQLSGKGIPDLAVLHRGKVYFMEVKVKGGRLTEAQIMWASDGWPTNLCRTPEEALKVLGL